jgi:hypothetical protein
MKSTTLFSLLMLLIFSTKSNAQTSQIDDTKEKISSYFSDYFKDDRETIHMVINKNKFITNETIWLKGYVKNRKTGGLFYQTNNINAILYSENGTKITQKLLYCSNGQFAGDFKLTDKLNSGDYYIQVFTNWMNNFDENESTIRKIEVVNPNNGIWETATNPNVENTTLKAIPEGKSFVESVSTSVGFSLKDCNNIPLPELEGQLLNAKNEVLKTLKTNKFGEGKFEITPKIEPYRIKFEYEGKVYFESLPLATANGYALEVNNYTLTGKTVVKIKTNKNTISQFSKKLYVVLNQDNKCYFFDVKLDENSLVQELIIPNDELPEGIATFRLIDENLDQWCERIVYYNQKENINANFTPDGKYSPEVTFNGKTNVPSVDFTVSLLPAESNGIDENHSIISAFNVNCYLKNPITNFNYFSTDANRLKLYELDLKLLNISTSKYEWNVIKNNTPKMTYEFERGIKIKGTVNNNFKSIEKYKAKLLSKKDLILETTDINEKNEFIFENVAIADSTSVEIYILKMPEMSPVDAKVTAKVLANTLPFKYTFRGIDNICPISKKLKTIDLSDLPILRNGIINLDNVTIVKEKKVLKYQNNLSNSMLRGYKIDNDFAFTDVLLFIESKGFIVNRDGVNLTISSRNITSFSGPRTSPAVYINDVLLFALDQLNFTRMEDIDEIYIDRRATVGSMLNSEGIIKIYLKPIVNNQKPSQANMITVTNSFQKYRRFKNIEYSNFDSKGFLNYGVIGWSPLVSSDENGTFGFSFANFYLNEYKVVMEGITKEGKLFYTEQVVKME